MGSDLITIVVPVYKVEKYLDECIKSLLNQTYRNIEIILIDDGSPDNCGKMCDEYEIKDNRIKVIHKENGGLSDARNHGIDIAQGKYITFVDSDDYVNDKYIEYLYNAIKTNKVQISQCNISKVNDEKQILCQLGYQDTQIKLGKEMIKDIYSEHWLENIVVWNKMYAIELFKELRYPVGKIHEDEFITYKILYSIEKVAIIKDCLYNYRQSEDSITGRKFFIKRLDALQAFEERMKFFEEKSEKELYDFTQRQYLLLIIEYYQKILKDADNSKNVLNDLLKKYRNEFKKTSTNEFINKEIKRDMNLFYYIPKILYKIQELREKKLIRRILSKLKKYIKIIIAGIKYKKYQKECKKSCQTEFLIFNSPIHGNIGDHAIIEAEYKMLEKLNIKAFEIPTYEEQYYFDYIKRNISKNATISITGGGFIGSQWMVEQNLVNKVIQNFKEHKIIIFPATFYFKEDEQGKNELQKSIKIINEAKNINIFARENKTYEFVKKTYPNANVKLVPDIVLSLKKEEYDDKREGILLCLRKDVEGNFSDEDKDIILNKITNYDKNIKKTDTVVYYTINPENREKELKEKLREFASSKMVITDRLHGMIFAVITNTPCIVFGNYNYKVKGVYEEWIKNNISNAIFVDNIEEIDKNIEKLLNLKNEYNVEFDFKELIRILEEC